MKQQNELLIERDDFQSVIEEICAYMIEHKDYEAYDFVTRMKEKYALNSDWLDNLEEHVNN